MSLAADLDDPDDLNRLLALQRAGREGGPELVGTLLDRALHDDTEVQVTGGVAERWDHVGDAAAAALAAVLRRHGTTDPRIRRAATDLAEDDERVGRLLSCLGGDAEPLRRELETSGEERLRLRALRAIRPVDRPVELGRRFLADPSPLVRLEALRGSARFGPEDAQRALSDVDAAVRLAAVHKARWHGTPAFTAAARVETVREIRERYVQVLAGRPLTGDVVRALVGYLDDDGWVGRTAAVRLRAVDDPGVAAAVASRILVTDDEASLLVLTGHPHLLGHAPDLRDDPAVGLGAVQRSRLLRAVLGWAHTLVESPGLAVWLAAPDDRTAAQWITEHDWFGAGPAAELLHAAVDGDLRRALAVDLASEPLRWAYLFTSRQIRAGFDPLPPRPLRRGPAVGAP